MNPARFRSSRPFRQKQIPSSPPQGHGLGKTGLKLRSEKQFHKSHGLKVVESESLGCSLDIFGTLLARQELRARKHENFVDRQWAKLARTGQKFLQKLLLSRRLQDHVVDLGPLYISNLATLRKVAGDR